jgi:hypothetical protein
MDRLAAQAQVNAFAGVRDPLGGEDHRRRAADIAAYGRALDDARAKYSPLFRAQRQYLETLREIAQFERAGALSTAEASAARTRTKDDFAAQVRQLRGLKDAGNEAAGGVRLAGH